MIRRFESAGRRADSTPRNAWRLDEIGTCIFTWHDDLPRYDEVRWDPKTVTKSEAAEIAVQRLCQDHRATRVHVAYLNGAFEEAVRQAPGTSA